MHEKRQRALAMIARLAAPLVAEGCAGEGDFDDYARQVRQATNATELAAATNGAIRHATELMRRALQRLTHKGSPSVN